MEALEAGSPLPLRRYHGIGYFNEQQEFMFHINSCQGEAPGPLEKTLAWYVPRLWYIVGERERGCPMAKTEMIRARVEPELKSQAEEVFSGLGLSPTEAITLFYRQVTLHHGLPFAVKIPNAETIAALQQARAGEGLTEYANLEDLKARHG